MGPSRGVLALAFAGLAAGAQAAGCGGSLGSTGEPSPDAGVEAASAAEGVEAGDESSTPSTEGCSGDVIVPDTDGFVSADSNASGITGPWTLYTDCDDLAALDAGEPMPGIDCSRVSSPAASGPFGPQPDTAQICTAGSTVYVDLDSQWATRWGAYVSLGLNAPDGTERAFDANAAGVSGFCFYVTGATIPVFRVRFPTTQGFDGNDYQVTLEHEGWHEVRFADLKQVTDTGVPFDASKVEAIEFEVPASMAEKVPWDFCIDGLTAIR